MTRFLRFSSLVVILVGVSLIARLYKITSPLADWHSFRQADTASVTREYVKHGIDLLHPKYQDLSNIQSGENNEGKDNVEGWRMVEFPLVNGVLALIIRALHITDIALVSRLASVLASLTTLVCLVYLVRALYGKRVALLTGWFFGLLPYSVYYSRVVLPEPFLLVTITTSLFFYYRSLEKRSLLNLFVSALLFGMALLLKPMAVFFVPAYLGLRLRQEKKIGLFDIYSFILFGLSTLPLVAWREWIKQYPLGIPASNWLYNGGGPGKRLSPVYNIRFKPAWWRWLFYERLFKLILGGAGFIPWVVGLIVFDPFLWLFGAGMLLYLIVFAAGNVQHDYYQIILVPFICLAAGKGAALVYRFLEKRQQKVLGIIALAVCLTLPLILSWKLIKGYYNINNPDIIVAGKAADKRLPPTAKVIAPYNGDTAFLFQTNRTGWPIGNDIEKKISEGAQYYVSVNYDDETNNLAAHYATVESTKQYIILDLTKPIK